MPKNQRPSSTTSKQMNTSETSFKARGVKNDSPVGSFGGAFSSQPESNSRPSDDTVDVKSQTIK